MDYAGADNYREAVRIAKEWSMRLGECIPQIGNQELAEVAICCYYVDDISSYNEVWQEVYINGKKEGRYEW